MKSKEILTIILMITIFAGIGVFFGLNGIKSHNNHYVRIEVNPKLEFITDSKNNVISYIPINEEAKILVCQENFIGLKVYDACLKFVDLCTKANYIDVDGENNAVRITTVSGLTHSLENKVYIKLNDYFKNKQIKAVIVESENDIDLISEAQNKHISSANKLMLISAILEKSADYSEAELKKLTETKLIDVLIDLHKNANHKPSTYTQEQLENKIKLIDLNRKKYESHMFLITNESISKFNDEFKEHNATYKNSYEENFNKEYLEWQKTL